MSVGFRWARTTGHYPIAPNTPHIHPPNRLGRGCGFRGGKPATSTKSIEEFVAGADRVSRGIHVNPTDLEHAGAPVDFSA